jgi:hypothetical protein
LSALELTVAAAALLIGLTGAWSPCGYSMVETIGPSGHCGGGRTTGVALATFTPGALLGGVVTYGSLAWLGGAIHGVDRGAYLAAAAIAALTALAEARGTPIVPQIRRQLPEGWRRAMPMPLAAGLYGVLLGLGFTTFVLSFGVWALAGISFALGEPRIGIEAGLAFGAGRAIPVLALAPIAARPLGARAITAMAEHPSLYRGLRLGDAASLTAVAAVLALSGPVAVASTVQSKAADPGVSGPDLVFQRSDRTGILRRGGADTVLPGSDPAIGGPYIAVRNGNEIDILDRTRPSIHVRDGIAAPGVDALAISREWLVYRAHSRRGDAIEALNILDLRDPGPLRLLARARAPGQLSQPSLAGRTVVFARAQPQANAIVEWRLKPASGSTRTLLRSTRAALLNPSTDGASLLYERVDHARQKLLLRGLSGGGQGKTLNSRRRGGPRLSTTSLGASAYVTLLSGSGANPSATILSFSR